MISRRFVLLLLLLFISYTKVPHKPMIVNHDVNATFHEDGKVQTFKFHTQRLRENMTVYISVTANNHVMSFNFT
jgi:hypothetical protein